MATDGVVLHRGSLLKYKSLLRWSPRTFTLTQEHLYCTGEGQEKDVTIHVSNLKITNSSGKYFNVEDGSRGLVVYLKASSVAEKIEWINAINGHTGSIVFKGALQKWTNLIKGWQSRYFILFSDRLCYYVEKQGSDPLRRGTIFLDRQQITVSNSSVTNGFDLITDSNTWHLRAGNPELMAEWVRQIERLLPATAVAPPTCSEVQSPPEATEDSDAEAHYRKDLECNVCLELLSEPTTLACGHSFCRPCLADMWATTGSPEQFKCPCCRAVIAGVPAVNVALQNVIHSLYDDQGIEAREASPNRARFEAHFAGGGAGSRTTGGGRRATAGVTLTVGTNGDLLKRAFSFIIILLIALRVTSTASYGPHPPSSSPGSDGAEELTERSTGDGTDLLFESKSTVMFLTMCFIECPRALAVYLALFMHNGVLQSAVNRIALHTGQAMGPSLYVKVILWGAVTPYVWAVPLLLSYRLFLLLPFALALGILEVWEGVLTLRELGTANNASQLVLKNAKMETVKSAGKLILYRIISYLPWYWLPDLLFYLILLFLFSDLAYKSVLRAKSLHRRTLPLLQTLARSD